MLWIGGHLEGRKAEDAREKKRGLGQAGCPVRGHGVAQLFLPLALAAALRRGIANLSGELHMEMLNPRKRPMGRRAAQ